MSNATYAIQSSNMSFLKTIGTFGDFRSTVKRKVKLKGNFKGTENGAFISSYYSKKEYFS